MQEWRGKYAEAEAVRTSPMIDGPVIFALGRTPMELFLPGPLAAFFLWRFGFVGLLVPLGVFVALPWARRRLGHNRLLHGWWGLGAVQPMRMTQRLLALAGARTGQEVPTPFVQSRIRRFGP